MKNKDTHYQLQQIRDNVYAYRKELFVLIIMLMYIYVAWRADVLGHAQPSQFVITSHETKLPQPHISQTTVNKIQQLQNNNVNVQSLFNQARQNPFQE